MIPGSCGLRLRRRRGGPFNYPSVGGSCLAKRSGCSCREVSRPVADFQLRYVAEGCLSANPCGFGHVSVLPESASTAGEFSLSWGVLTTWRGVAFTHGVLKIL
jgi:hypothetical protein